MPRRKPGTSMKSHTIRMTDEEWAEMQRCAEIADESDSEYIRKSVAVRNKQYNDNPKIGEYNVVPGKEHPIYDCDSVGKVTGIKSPMVNTFMKGEKK